MFGSLKSSLADPYKLDIWPSHARTSRARHHRIRDGKCCSSASSHVFEQTPMHRANKLRSCLRFALSIPQVSALFASEMSSPDHSRSVTSAAMAGTARRPMNALETDITRVVPASGQSGVSDELLLPVDAEPLARNLDVARILLDSDPASSELRGGDGRRAGAEEAIEDQVIGL